MVTLSAVEFLQGELRSLTREAYLLAWGVQALLTAPPDQVAAGLEQAVRALCVDPEAIRPGSIEMRQAEVDEERTGLAAALAEILVVRLDAAMHGFLGHLVGRPPSAREVRFELDLDSVWPVTSRKPAELWSVKQLILLAEVRNHIVHGGGVLRNSKRLIAAGWDPAELPGLVRYEAVGIDNFFEFKRAVRTAANAAIDQIGAR